MSSRVFVSGTSFQNLTDLFTALGYHRADQPFDDISNVIARWHSFDVVARESATPTVEVVQLARDLGQRGQHGLAVCWTPRRRLAIATPRIASGGVSHVLAVDLPIPQDDLPAQLTALRPHPSANGIRHAFRVETILSADSVSARFYNAFRVVYDRMVETLPKRYSSADRQLAALLPLLRVLFLYFVQTKGWLNHRPDYLIQLFDQALSQRKHFHRDRLNPLFFETLNREPSRRSPHARLGRIPYLNGGLFEPHLSERRLGITTFSNDVWCDVFDKVFECFRFSVAERHDGDAIAPDMLGHVFERVMHIEDRHTSGSFYTPEPVVHQLVHAALTTAIHNRSQYPHDTVRKAFEGKGSCAALRDIIAVLNNMTILDPAVGSGAFLMGALSYVTAIKQRIHKRLGQPFDVRRCREHTIDRALFGVDINPIAVRLAELRLWLSLIADDSTTDIANVRPLPNLDGKVRQGDSLLDPLSDAIHTRTDISQVPKTLLTEVALSRRSVFESFGHNQRQALEVLRTVETALARQLTSQRIAQLERDLKEVDSVSNEVDLFAQRGTPTKAQTHRTTALRREISRLKSLTNRIDGGLIPFFSFDVHAPDAMAEGGFDIVLGNPPWVRAERIPSSMRTALRNRFSWWTSNTASGTGFNHLPDLSVAFLQRAVELAKPNGVVAFLVPSKLLSATYAHRARTGLVCETQLQYLHRIPAHQAEQFGATTYPLALVASRRAPPPNSAVSLDFDDRNTIPQRELAAEGPWMLTDRNTRKALTHLRSAGTPLREVAPPHLGVKTGANAIFVGSLIPGTQRSGSHLVQFGQEQIHIPSDLLRPAIRGRDVAPFRVSERKVMLWLYDSVGQPRKKLPREVHGFLEHHRMTLEHRSDYVEGPLWTLFRLRAGLAKYRVIWPDITRHLPATILRCSGQTKPIPLNTCYVCTPTSKPLALVISATLNSSYARVLIRATSNEARGGYRRANADVVGAVPIPSLTTAIGIQLADWSKEAHRRGTHNQEELDHLIAESLSLTTATRKVLSTIDGYQS